MSAGSDLGRLLELLYGARWRFRTARGVLYHRGSRRLGREAMERETERVNSRSGARVMRQVTLYGAGGGEEPPDLEEERLRFWWEPPGRLREEVEYETQGSQRISVHDGELWWLYTPHQGAISNVELDAEERAQYGAGGGERFKPLLEPSGFLVALEFGEISREDGLLRVRARPRRDDVEATVGHLHMRLGGADEFELEVDAEVRIIHRLTAERDGVRYLVAHGDPTHGRQNQVVFERAGTRLELRSELEAETLLALAADLRPVEDGLPTG